MRRNFFKKNNFHTLMGNFLVEYNFQQWLTLKMKSWKPAWGIF